MGVAVVGMDSLSERAAMMRESLQKSQTITDKVVSILGSFDHRLSALETAMRPTQIRTHSIRKAHENIDKTLKVAEVLLAQFDLSRQSPLRAFQGAVQMFIEPPSSVRLDGLLAYKARVNELPIWLRRSREGLIEKCPPPKQVSCH